ncbi:MAG: hypothetical protein ACO37W_04815 [Prochlorotrichaceae cyanobacterium]
MPPESFDPRKTDLQSLLRSGTWLYQTGQRAALPPPDRSEGAPPSSLSFNDINDLNLSDVDLEDVDFNTLNLYASSEFSDPEDSDYPLPLSPIEPRISGEQPLWGEAKQGQAISAENDLGSFLDPKPWAKWGWLLITLGVLIPLGMVKGTEWFSRQEALPLSSATLSPPQSLLQVGDNFVLLEQALQNADHAIALTLNANTINDWQRIADYWQNAIETLQAIPPSNPNYATAQNRLVSYHSQLDYAQGQLHALANQAQTLPQQEQIFRAAVKAATQAAERTQNATTPQDWQGIVEQWEAAIAGMTQIRVQSPHYRIAQDRIPTYTTNLDYAKRQAGVLP